MTTVTVTMPVRAAGWGSCALSLANHEAAWRQLHVTDKVKMHLEIWRMIVKSQKMLKPGKTGGCSKWYGNVRSSKEHLQNSCLIKSPKHFAPPKLPPFHPAPSSPARSRSCPQATPWPHQSPPPQWWMTIHPPPSWWMLVDVSASPVDFVLTWRLLSFQFSCASRPLLGGSNCSNAGHCTFAFVFSDSFYTISQLRIVEWVDSVSEGLCPVFLSQE